MPAKEIFINEASNGFRMCFRESSSFNPSREVLSGEYQIMFPLGRLHVNYINTNFSSQGIRPCRVQGFFFSRSSSFRLPGMLMVHGVGVRLERFKLKRRIGTKNRNKVFPYRQHSHRQGASLRPKKTPSMAGNNQPFTAAALIYFPIKYNRNH